MQFLSLWVPLALMGQTGTDKIRQLGPFHLPWTISTMKWSGHFQTITFYKLRPTLTIKARFNKSLRNLLQQISPQIFIARRVLWKRLLLSSLLIVILVLLSWIFIIIGHYWKHSVDINEDFESYHNKSLWLELSQQIFIARVVKITK